MLSFAKYKQVNESFAGMGAMALGFGRNGFAENPMSYMDDPDAAPDIDPDTGEPIDPDAAPDIDPDTGEPIVAPKKSKTGKVDLSDVDLDTKLGGPDDPDAPVEDPADATAGGEPEDGVSPPPDVEMNPDPNAPPPEDPNVPHMCSKCMAHMSKKMKAESKKPSKKNLKTETKKASKKAIKNETAEEKAWRKSVESQMNAPINPKYNDGIGRVLEDKLIQPEGEVAQTYHRNDDDSPKPGEPGFAPQGRIGSLGSYAEWSSKYTGKKIIKG